MKQEAYCCKPFDARSSTPPASTLLALPPAVGHGTRFVQSSILTHCQGLKVRWLHKIPHGVCTSTDLRGSGEAPPAFSRKAGIFASHIR